MSVREELFKNALIELAKEGSEKAQFVLTLAEVGFNTTEYDKNAVVVALKESNRALSDALYQNGVAWSKTTDRHIMKAQSRIDDALGLLALKS